MKKFILTIIILLSANAANANGFDTATNLLHEEISAKISSATMPDKLDVDINKGKLELQIATSDDVQISALELDERSKRFSAVAIIANAAPLEINGSYVELVEVPTLKRRMGANEVISAEDIAYTDIDSRKAERGFVADEAALIGKSPARTIAANRPILLSQIKEQDLVKEKQSVTIYFKNNLIEMQDLGVALEDGAKNDVIRVKNAASNIVISAHVFGENLVEVMPQGSILASR